MHPTEHSAQQTLIKSVHADCGTARRLLQVLSDTKTLCEDVWSSTSLQRFLVSVNAVALSLLCQNLPEQPSPEMHTLHQLHDTWSNRQSRRH